MVKGGFVRCPGQSVDSPDSRQPQSHAGLWACPGCLKFSRRLINLRACPLWGGRMYKYSINLKFNPDNPDNPDKAFSNADYSL